MCANQCLTQNNHYSHIVSERDFSSAEKISPLAKLSNAHWSVYRPGVMMVRSSANIISLICYWFCFFHFRVCSWSFGVVLWETMTLGKNTDNWDNSKIWKKKRTQLLYFSLSNMFALIVAICDICIGNLYLFQVFSTHLFVINFSNVGGLFTSPISLLFFSLFVLPGVSPTIPTIHAYFTVLLVIWIDSQY